jgi:hypothetical protein
VKLNLKLNKRQVIIAAVAALAVFGLMTDRSAPAAEPGTLDAAAGQACTEFADGYPQAQTETARLALADRVTASAARSTSQSIAGRATDLGDSANDGDAGWTAGAEAFAEACRDAGFTG